MLAQRALDAVSQGISASPTSSFAAVRVSSSVGEALITAQDHPGVLYSENQSWVILSINQIADAYLDSRIDRDKQGERPDIAHWTFIKSVIKAARQDEIGALMVWWNESNEGWVGSFNKS